MLERFGQDLTCVMTGEATLNVRKMLVDELMTAMSHVHRKGFMHGDLKPQK